MYKVGLDPGDGNRRPEASVSRLREVKNVRVKDGVGDVGEGKREETLGTQITQTKRSFDESE
jgi:hypothetical protein